MAQQLALGLSCGESGRDDRIPLLFQRGEVAGVPIVRRAKPADFLYYRQVLVAGSCRMVRFLFMALVILGLIGLATMLGFVLR